MQLWRRRRLPWAAADAAAAAAGGRGGGAACDPRARRAVPVSSWRVTCWFAGAADRGCGGGGGERLRGLHARSRRMGQGDGSRAECGLDRVAKTAVPPETVPFCFTCNKMDSQQLDDLIERLLEVKNGRPGKQVQLAENEIRLLCLTAKEIFMYGRQTHQARFRAVQVC